MPRYVLGLGASCFEVGGYGSVFGTLSEVLSWKGEVDHRLGAGGRNRASLGCPCG